MIRSPAQVTISLILALCIFTGCFYAGPQIGNAPADLGELGMIETRTGTGRLFHAPANQSARPTANPPTSIAIARVQQRSDRRYDRTVSVWEYTDRNNAQPTERQLEATDDLPLVDDAITIVPRASYTSEPLVDTLRRAASVAHAGLLLIYTFETTTDETDGIPPLDLVTLSTLPDKVVTAKTLCHAVLLDTATGYIYAHARSDDEAWNLSNHWSVRDSASRALERAERRAFDSMMTEFSVMWDQLRATYRW